MTKTSKLNEISDPARKQAVVYARVSSKEQEKEGFSIPAQLKLLKVYAAAQGFAVVQEYVDVETAKQTSSIGGEQYEPAVALKKVAPAYSTAARTANVTGLVIVSVWTRKTPPSSKAMESPPRSRAA